VPAVADGQACPDVTWAGTDQTPTNLRATGIDDPCGFSIDLGGTLDAGQSVDVVAAVELDLGEDPDAVDAWLERAAETTAADLESDAVTAGLFPVQRLAAIRMDVQDGLNVRSRDVEVRLIPQWVDGTESVTAPLLNTAVTGDPSPELLAVAGGMENIKLRENCGGALSIENLRVSVVRFAEECTLEAEVGEYDDIIGGPFAIDPLGG
jgi:serine/threonine-protein kinase